MGKDTKLWGMLRLLMGWTFLWAFFDKLLGWGFATKPDASWLNGGSPTAGFLKFGVHGPFASIYNSLAGSSLVTWLFMLGLLGIGLTLTLGMGVKVGAWCGAAMVALMYFALIPPVNNPITDEHVLEFLVLVGLALTSSQPGTWLGFGKKWMSMGVVQKYKWLE